jgi:hypothetical protein
MSMVVHVYNPSTGEAEVEGFQVQGHPGLCSETLSQKSKAPVLIPAPQTNKQTNEYSKSSGTLCCETVNEYTLSRGQFISIYEKF